ncbi:hypothetical protein K437DRAFT_275822 [Tilletiaria anomala UBC 951]|uniref:Peptidase S49 domain-containing protein n=1 Tax=Tilletiaria anomala (strain ATCC 24038 / CBS 436.72 / UBC 951) TaxID=1037660 RepID=A0A066VI69_TILAU|nr:uncharacterized protein K437DRAFT_275822 [Tilletiaria anomala UBC 951]KDN40013.1 hypothetical protein K437DRAFT_275822 [Tilletiaria anomala UBC 951]
MALDPGQGTTASGPSTTASPTPQPVEGNVSSSTPVPNSRLARSFPRLTATFQKFSQSRAGHGGAFVWRYRRGFLIGFGLTYTALAYSIAARDRYLRDYVHDNTYLVWKIYPGAVVESRSPASLSNLLMAPSPGEDAPKVLELFEAIRALKYAQQDPRIRGIFADFSSLHVPSSVAPDPLGLAQIEELHSTIHEFKAMKKEQLQDEKARVAIAWSDSFESQGAYLLASAFDEVYVQPSGGVPLIGLSAQIPFIRKLLNWAGIKVHAMARKEYKSMVSTFVEEEELPPAQTQNEAELFGELNRSMCHMIAVSRFPDLDADEAESKVADLAKDGPYSGREALQAGLIDGVKHKRELIESLFQEEKPSGGGEKEEKEGKKVHPRQVGELRLDAPEAPKFKSLWDYNRINNKTLDRNLSDDEIVEVGVVYLNSSITSVSASSVIKGLNELADDDEIKSAVIRIDSGGGDVVASESIWDAVRRVKARKPIVASFGNISASGGYYAATAADAITASESTVTGSIGVASIRPIITKKFFDRLGISIQSFFTGSTANSALHEADAAQKARQEQYMDETYADFLQKVCEGRQMTKEEADKLAGGRVYTGLSAFVACNQGVEAEFDEESGILTMHNAEGEEEGTFLIKPAEGSVKTEEAERKSSPTVSKAPKKKKVKISDLTFEWSTQSSETGAGNKITTIVGHKRSPVQDEKCEDGDEIPLRTAIMAEEPESSVDESKQQDASNQNASRGLIDMLGGLYDATLLSVTLGMKKEWEKKGEEMPEQPESLAADLRLVKFPREKAFLQRVRELNRKGDQPSLSWDAFKMECTAMIARAALRSLAISASQAEPTDLVKAFQDPTLGSLTAKTRMKMQYFGMAPQL